MWSIAGSYYTRQGTQDLDDTWALLNHEWTDWRDEATIESCKWSCTMPHRLQLMRRRNRLEAVHRGDGHDEHREEQHHTGMRRHNGIRLSPV